ncbi:MAG TPA: hypothetical protein PLE19_12100 [Planctomycetota bacterium]|nr:hypothetical protein [Planctomycetota bacterium]HRR80519.1 hypothetical protein [Planctomycetota bacterium]HRT97131.1 hypothetical protein [Planctomycetota bacterium]
MDGTERSRLVAHGGLDSVKLLDVKAMAELLGVSERLVWRLSALSEAGRTGACNGFPRPVRIATKTIRWRLKDVEAYLGRLVGEGNR